MPAADHRALLAVERASRLRLLPELVDLPELAVAELRRASSALPRIDRLGGFRNRHRARLTNWASCLARVLCAFAACSICASRSESTSDNSRDEWNDFTRSVSS